MNTPETKGKNAGATVPANPGTTVFHNRPAMEMHVTWDKSGRFIAKTTGGCEISMAANRDVQAAGKYPSALEVFVASLGGCPSHEILAAMQERKKTVTNISVKIEGTRRDTPPKTFEKMHVTFTLAGDIDDALAREVIHDVMTRRCPVAVSFGMVTDLSWDHCVKPVPTSR